ncbi:hypothetical protein [Ferrimonas lipolytica]|uniref:Uncharacterized protein n=1 Tax=Ferrimonas lipolytica TaxID=2724191 RepID=A0A6H1ULB8_9GAMM|nr:hypothetical protein [Ferrimonas lipolytica]QIZ78592.1 hypothetical protein HER31_17800 [Ferrimonas lipolytica]
MPLIFPLLLLCRLFPGFGLVADSYSKITLLMNKLVAPAMVGCVISILYHGSPSMFEFVVISLALGGNIGSQLLALIESQLQQKMSDGAAWLNTLAFTIILLLATVLLDGQWTPMLAAGWIGYQLLMLALLILRVLISPLKPMSKSDIQSQ